MRQEDVQPPNAVIMTVGLPGDQGGDIIDALALDLEAFKPEFLALIASRQSRPNAERMLERSGLGPEQTEIVELENAHDIDEVFRRTTALIQSLVARGFSAERIAINYTSGTKVMGSGAVLSAVFNSVMELRYITGLASVRDGSKSRHRILSTKPAAVFAYQQMLAGRGMLLELRYRSALEAFKSASGDLLSPADRQLLEALSTLTRAYDAWDNFIPARFLELYRTVEFGEDSLEAFRLDEDQVRGVEKLAGEIAGGEFGPSITIDLFNNALRRLSLGRVADALARLYRALEMLAQMVLSEDCGIDTNDVDTRRIPPRDRVAFEAMRSREDGLVKIGMRKAYDLLIIMQAPLGVRFKEDPVMREFLDKRGDSILAHGLDPVEGEEALRYMTRARDLFRVVIPEFDTISCRLQFPWLDPCGPLTAEDLSDL